MKYFPLFLLISLPAQKCPKGLIFYLPLQINFKLFNTSVFQSTSKFISNLSYPSIFRVFYVQCA